RSTRHPTADAARETSAREERPARSQPNSPRPRPMALPGTTRAHSDGNEAQINAAPPSRRAAGPKGSIGRAVGWDLAGAITRPAFGTRLLAALGTSPHAGAGPIGVLPTGLSSSGASVKQLEHLGQQMLAPTA